MSFLGGGNEYSVSVDPIDERRVRKDPAVFAMQETEPYSIKARYYLTKILHALLPESIPDVYEVSIDEEEKAHNITQRVHPDLLHQQLMRAKFANDRMGKNPPDEYYPLREQKYREVTQDPAYTQLIKTLQSFGVGFDGDPSNFTKTEDGKFVYLDTVSPLLFPEKEGLEALKAAITDRLPSQEQPHVLRLLDRYQEIAKRIVES